MKKLLFIIWLIGIIKLSYGQSCHNVKELLRKRHTISGMTYGHPYTMFDRHNLNYKNLDNAINNIRININKDSILRLAYKSIYTNAISNMPTDDGTMNINDKTPSKLAIWAKNNAFVFLIGVDGNGKLIFKL